jgi:putative ABC transport system ATP-binding protein
MPEAPSADIANAPLLAVRGLTWARPTSGAAVPVLTGIDFSLDAGELVDISGPSGGGKTTLLLALARLLPGAAHESLALAGVSAEHVVAGAWRTAVALLPQKPVLVPGDVRDDLLVPWALKVRAGRPLPDDRTLRAALDSVGLDDVELTRPAPRLSVGQAARVALLRVVLTEPRVLLLDEADAALDDESAAQVASVVRAFVGRGGAAVRVRHLRADESADRRLRLADGRLSDVAP